MESVILLAGSGSRLKREDLPHKSLLPFGNGTLLSRHLTSLQELGIERVHLVLGHNCDRIKEYVQGLGLTIPVNFVDNDLFRTTGNTLSVVLGLREFRNDALILDGDVLYPRKIFYDYVRNSPSSTFAVVPVHMDNAEAAKVLIKPDGAIKAFISKRALTRKEMDGYKFGGEAVGFFKFSQNDVQTFLSLYGENESKYINTLWEISFTDLAQKVDFRPWSIRDECCFEIDTQEDYEHALTHFENNRDLYG